MPTDPRHQVDPITCRPKVGRHSLGSGRHRLRGHFPACLNATGQHLAAILTYLLVDEPIELVVHGDDEFTMLFATCGETLHLQGIGLGVVQLDIIETVEIFQRLWQIMLLRREIACKNVLAIVNHPHRASSYREH
jgi:hypothetical protein